MEFTESVFTVRRLWPRHVWPLDCDGRWSLGTRQVSHCDVMHPESVVDRDWCLCGVSELKKWIKQSQQFRMDSSSIDLRIADKLSRYTELITRLIVQDGQSDGVDEQGHSFQTSGWSEQCSSWNCQLMFRSSEWTERCSRWLENIHTAQFLPTYDRWQVAMIANYTSGNWRGHRWSGNAAMRSRNTHTIHSLQIFGVCVCVRWYVCQCLAVSHWNKVDGTVVRTLTRPCTHSSFI